MLYLFLITYQLLHVTDLLFMKEVIKYGAAIWLIFQLTCCLNNCVTITVLVSGTQMQQYGIIITCDTLIKSPEQLFTASINLRLSKRS